MYFCTVEARWSSMLYVTVLTVWPSANFIVPHSCLHPRQRFIGCGSSISTYWEMSFQHRDTASGGPAILKSSTYTDKYTFILGCIQQLGQLRNDTKPIFLSRSSRCFSQKVPASGWPQRAFFSLTTGLQYLGTFVPEEAPVPHSYHESGHNSSGSRTQVSGPFRSAWM